MLFRQFSDKSILITGASGFIGSGIVRYLNDLGIFNLVLVDDLKNGKRKNLENKKYLELIPKEELFQYLEGKESSFKAVIHLGACSSTICQDKDYLYENNYLFTKRLAKIALRNNLRFIYASSAATYGDGSLGFLDDENYLFKLKPLNLYGESKHLFDIWAKKNNVLNKITGLKYFNVFGPNESHKKEMSSMIFKMFEKVKNEGKISLFKSNDLKNFKDGEQKRDFLYVKDAAEMTCLFLKDQYRRAVGIFNIGSGIATSWNILARALFKALKKQEDIEYIDMPEKLTNQYQNFTKAEMGKFNSLNAGIKLTGIEEAVKDYVQNYLMEDKRW